MQVFSFYAQVKSCFQFREEGFVIGLFKRGPSPVSGGAECRDISNYSQAVTQHLESNSN